MQYEWTAIPDAEVPQAQSEMFQHLLDTYVSETNKTASMWKAIPEDLLEFKPHPKCNAIRAVLAHQLLSERRFFAQFVGISEPPAEQLLPTNDPATVQEYVDKYVWLARKRLPQFAAAEANWWTEEMPFFGGLKRQRIWIFWRRVLHTCHHRTQIQAWLRMGEADFVPAIYGPSHDVQWDEADPTYTLDAADRSGAGRPSRSRR